MEGKPQNKQDKPQKEFDKKRDVTDVSKPGGHVRGILDGTNDPIFREITPVKKPREKTPPVKEPSPAG